MIRKNIFMNIWKKISGLFWKSQDSLPGYTILQKKKISSRAKVIPLYPGIKTQRNDQPA
jgi:hypothetical protein